MDVPSIDGAGIGDCRPLPMNAHRIRWGGLAVPRRVVAGCGGKGGGVELLQVAFFVTIR